MCMDSISEYLGIGKRTTERKLGSKTAERRVVWKKESDSQEAQGVSKTIPEERYKEADQHGAGASQDLEAQSSRSLSFPEARNQKASGGHVGEEKFRFCEFFREVMFVEPERELAFSATFLCAKSCWRQSGRRICTKPGKGSFLQRNCGVRCVLRLERHALD